MNLPDTERTDGNYGHAWVRVGEDEGISVYECVRCGAEYHEGE